MSLAPESIVLLGAGASKEAGVPTTFEATRQLVERIASRPRDQSFASALHFVCGALLAYDAADGTSPFNSLDVERVFAAVQLLAERRTLEVTPFVASWHPAVDALDQPPRNAPMGFDRNLIDGIARGRGIHSPERMITQLIESVTKTGGGGQTYMGLAQRMLTELRQLVATTSKDVGYLTPLVSQSEQAKCLTIATLNYDLAIEGAGMLGGVVVTTGIDDWISTGDGLGRPTGFVFSSCMDPSTGPGSLSNRLMDSCLGAVLWSPTPQSTTYGLRSWFSDSEASCARRARFSVYSLSLRSSLQSRVGSL